MEIVSRQFRATSKVSRGGKFASVSLQTATQADMDRVDRKLCEDYLKRKDAGTLKLIKWKDARKQLDL